MRAGVTDLMRDGQATDDWTDEMPGFRHPQRRPRRRKGLVILSLGVLTSVALGLLPVAASAKSVPGNGTESILVTESGSRVLSGDCCANTSRHASWSWRPRSPGTRLSSPALATPPYTLISRPSTRQHPRPTTSSELSPCKIRTRHSAATPPSPQAGCIRALSAPTTASSAGATTARWSLLKASSARSRRQRCCRAVSEPPGRWSAGAQVPTMRSTDSTAGSPRSPPVLPSHARFERDAQCCAGDGPDFRPLTWKSSIRRHASHGRVAEVPQMVEHPRASTATICAPWASLSRSPALSMTTAALLTSNYIMSNSRRCRMPAWR